MRNTLAILQSNYDDMVFSSISKLGQSGQNRHQIYFYSLNLKDLNRARLTRELHDFIIGYFANNNVLCEYNELYRSFAITLDLTRCQMTPDQSSFYTQMLDSTYQ